MVGIRGKQFEEDTLDPTQTLRVFSNTGDGAGEAFTNSVVDSIFAAGAVANSKLVFEANQSLASFKITSLAPGVDGTDAVNKNQLDAAISGLRWKDAALCASTVDLASEAFGATGVTYANGTAGVGATLTQDDPTDGVLTDLDAVVLVAADRVLIKDQTAGAENGIYEVTAVGDGAATPWVLTRVVDADESLELDGAAVFVLEGAASGDKGFNQTASGAAGAAGPVIGTDALTWAQFTGGGALTGGDGIDISGSTVSVDLTAASGLEFSANQLQADVGDGLQIGGSVGGANEINIDVSAFAGTGLEDDASENLRLAAQGNGIAGGAGSVLSVNSDVTTGGNIIPANVVANGVGLDIDLLDGNGLEISGNLLAVDPDTTTGGNIVPVTSAANGVGLDVSGIAGSGLVADGAGNLDVDGSTATFKAPVRVATTANTALTGLLTIDGVTLIAGDRILVKDQTTTTEDGIYIAAAGAWTRAVDAAVGIDVAQTYIPVAEGTVNGDDKLFRETSAIGSGVVGTNDLSYVEFSTGASALAGNGLVENLGALDVNVGTGIELDSDTVRLATQGTGIAGGAGSTLSFDATAADGNGLTGSGSTLTVDPDSETGGNIIPVNVTANGVGLDIDLLDGDGLQITSNLLTVDSDTETGGSILGANITANGVGIDVAALDGTGLAVSGTELLIDVASTVDFSSSTPVWTFGNETTAEGLFVSGTPVDGNHVPNKTYVDNLITGISWKEPVCVIGLIGENTIAQINALTPVTGDAVIAADAGTPSAGTSDALTIGDLAEYDGTSWIKLYDAVASQLPINIRATLSTTQALTTPFTDATDDGKVVISVADSGTFNGASSDWEDESDAVDGNAVLVQCDESAAAESANENNGYVFDGAVPTGSWIQFTGAGQIVAGTGLTKSGNTLNVGAGDGITVNANDVALATSAAGAGLTYTTGVLAVVAEASDEGAAITVNANDISIDGDIIDIDYAQTNYTPATTGTGVDVNDLAAHLEGIDNALGSVAGGGAPAQESITTEVITGSDTALSTVLSSTPVSNASVSVYLNGVFQRQGATFDYTISGTAITWLASSGTAVDMDTSDILVVTYEA